MEANIRSLVGAAIQVFGLVTAWVGCVTPFIGVGYVGQFIGLSMAESSLWVAGVGLCMAAAGLFYQVRAVPADTAPPRRWAMWRFTHGGNVLAFGASLLLFLAGLWLGDRYRSSMLATALLGMVCGMLPGLAPGRFACLKAVLLTGLLALMAGCAQWVRYRWGSGTTDFPGFSGALTVTCLAGLLLLPPVLLGCGMGRLARWVWRWRAAWR